MGNKQSQQQQQLQQQDTTQYTYQMVFANQPQCMISQMVEVLEMLTGFETSNKYWAKFPNNTQLKCAEHSNFFLRYFLGNGRPFEMTVICGISEVLRFNRPFTLLCPYVDVWDPKTTTKLGTIKMECSFCETVFTVFVGEVAKYKVVRTFCGCWTFKIFDIERVTVIGEIGKKWSGVGKEFFTDADNFGVIFPPNATTEDRAVLFAATFLIDYVCFENSRKQRH